MGLSLGGSAGGSSEKTTSSNTGSTQKTYTSDQTSLQGSLIAALQQLISGPTSPQVAAAQTQSADQINTEYSTAADRTNKFLAARGFGSSGQAGKVALQTELGRQGALAANSANYGKTGLELQQQSLQDALSAAFNNTGTTSASNGTGTSDSFNWGVNGGVKI